MNPKVFAVLRFVTGVFLVIFGLDKFFHFVPIDMSGLSEAAANYMQALEDSKVIYLVGALELLSGLAFIFNRYGALMALVLLPISVNAVWFHASLDMANIAGSLILLVLNVAVILGYKDRYTGVLKP